MNNSKKTLFIKSRGRKYFECVLNEKYKAKLTINEVSKNVAIGDTITLVTRILSNHVLNKQEQFIDSAFNLVIDDVSIKGEHGSKIQFVPVFAGSGDNVRTFMNHEIEQQKAQICLIKAEEDVSHGKFFSANVNEVLTAKNSSLLSAPESVSLRFCVLRNKVEEKKREQQDNLLTSKLFPHSEQPEFNVPVMIDGKRVIFDGTIVTTERKGSYYRYRLCDQVELSEAGN